MPIPSANPDFEVNPAKTVHPIYRHGIDTRESFIPMAFQVTSPINERLALLSHALVMHVNPQNMSETHNKRIERIQTEGGFVEQHWPDDLSEISADGVTGAFMNIRTGLSSVVRQRTIAWSRYRDLYDLYRNNGAVYDPFGNVVLQGNIMLMYDRGTYYGKFRSFKVDETDDSPYMFRISWVFKVEQIVLQIPTYLNSNRTGPVFQTQNRARSAAIPTTQQAPTQASPVPQITASEAAQLRAARNSE